MTEIAVCLDCGNQIDVSSACYHCTLNRREGDHWYRFTKEEIEKFKANGANVGNEYNTWTKEETIVPGQSYTIRHIIFSANDVRSHRYDIIKDE